LPINICISWFVKEKIYSVQDVLGRTVHLSNEILASDNFDDLKANLQVHSRDLKKGKGEI